MRNMRRTGHNVRGVSLIEALVALAVLSFGMLGVAGVQTTLRQNADIARQRAEAVRLAQEAIENWRTAPFFPDAGQATVERTYDVALEQFNTTFTVRRRVDNTDPDVASPPAHTPVVRSVRVEVEWDDRTRPRLAGGAQPKLKVVLDSLHGGVGVSAGSAVLNTAPPGAASALPAPARAATIPRDAKNLGLLSVFKPPVPGGAGSDGAGGTVAWVFDNLSGMIVGVCTVAAASTTSSLDLAAIASCSDNAKMLLVGGHVRFATANVQPTAADAEFPSSLARNLDLSVTVDDGRVATCHDDAPLTAVQAATQSIVRYWCAIPANATLTWSGFSTVQARPFADDATSAWVIETGNLPGGTPATHRLCRYTPATSDAQPVANADHPRRYAVEYFDPTTRRQPRPMKILPNQNFLVILAAYGCPTDGPADPAAGDAINSNTLDHRPVP